MDLPNEVILIVLTSLPKSDLKQIRLACKHLATLGAQVLIGTLHISPRDADMEIFDAITQHPDLSRSVQNLFLDTAQFKKYTSKLEYYEALCEQLTSRKYAIFRGRKDIVWWLAGTPTPTLLMKHNSDMGYQEYCRLSTQQQNLLSGTWFDRVCGGLRSVGPINAVTLGNTFTLRLSPDICPDDSASDIEDDEYDYDAFEYRIDDPEGYDGDRDNYTSHASCIRLTMADIIAGKRSVGSPVARGWPFTSLQPTAQRITRHGPNATIEEMVRNGESDGSFEFRASLQLLEAAAKQPSFFGIMGGFSAGSGIPSTLFGIGWPHSIQSLGVWNRLKVLRLKLAYYDTRGTSQASPLDRLKSMFHSIVALEEFTLALPLNYGNDDIEERYYNFSQVFPPITNWRLPRLTSFTLCGLRSSFRDIVGLFFLSFPQLKSLQLGVLGLTDGRWEYIIEGLRHHIVLEECYIGGELANPNLDPFFAPKYGRGYDDFEKDLSEYVVHGGRHPCLPVDWSDDASSEYLAPVTRTLHELQLSAKKYQKRQESERKLLV